ncbi:MAG: hypothetical protein ACK4YP_12910 [Myxococcota bacterium]
MAEERDEGPGEARADSSAGEGRERRLASEEPLGEMFSELLGKLWRRGRVEMEKAARKGRERLTLRQLRADRDRMYQKLGKEARQLLEAGDIDHPGLRRGVERVRELEARLLEAEDAVRASGGDPYAAEKEGEAEESSSS